MSVDHSRSQASGRENTPCKRRKTGGRKRENLIGQRFGRLIVVELLPNFRCRCLCDCGRYHETVAARMKRGACQSCGCLPKPGYRTHGLLKTPGYRSWQLLKQRCLNPNDDHYPDYGGRGIKVCERWLGEDGFKNFVADMGPRPTKRHTIDRINVNGDYCPENCRWATPQEQGRNRRDNTILTCDGVSKCLVQWSDDTGISIQTIITRLKRGWSIEETLKTPTKRGNNATVRQEAGGTQQTSQEENSGLWRLHGG